jgi:hypothetical protein
MPGSHVVWHRVLETPTVAWPSAACSPRPGYSDFQRRFPRPRRSPTGSGCVPPRSPPATLRRASRSASRANHRSAGIRISRQFVAGRKALQLGLASSFPPAPLPVVAPARQARRGGTGVGELKWIASAVLLDYMVVSICYHNAPTRATQTARDASASASPVIHVACDPHHTGSLHPPLG